MNNGISDLNNHLFACLETISDSDLKGDALTNEIERSKAIIGVSKEIISGGKLMLEAKKEFGNRNPDSATKFLGMMPKDE